MIGSPSGVIGRPPVQTVAGLALAYLLDPVADWFERRGFSRGAATLTILVIFVVFFIVALVLLIPALFAQLTGLIERLPALALRTYPSQRHSRQ